MARLAHQINEFDGPHPVRREELAASQRLSLQCFPGFREELTEKALLASYVPPRRGGVQVLSHRGVPVSQIGIYHSQVNLYGCPLRIASIGGVCTHSGCTHPPATRGLGLATWLLELTGVLTGACLHKLVAEGARLMLVSGDPMYSSAYTRLGCVAAQDFEAIVLKPTPLIRQSCQSVFSLRPATAADASLCARLYQSEAVHFVRRVDEFAEHFSRLEEFPRAEDWVVESQGQPVAYMFLGVPWELLFFPQGAIEPEQPPHYRGAPTTVGPPPKLSGRWACGRFLSTPAAAQPWSPGVLTRDWPRPCYSPGWRNCACSYHARTWTCCNYCEYKGSPETRHPSSDIPCVWSTCPV